VEQWDEKNNDGTKEVLEWYWRVSRLRIKIYIALNIAQPIPKPIMVRMENSTTAKTNHYTTLISSFAERITFRTKVN